MSKVLLNEGNLLKCVFHFLDVHDRFACLYGLQSRFWFQENSKNIRFKFLQKMFGENESQKIVSDDSTLDLEKVYKIRHFMSPFFEDIIKFEIGPTGEIDHCLYSSRVLLTNHPLRSVCDVKDFLFLENILLLLKISNQELTIYLSTEISPHKFPNYQDYNLKKKQKQNVFQGILDLNCIENTISWKKEKKTNRSLSFSTVNDHLSFFWSSSEVEYLFSDLHNNVFHAKKKLVRYTKGGTFIIILTSDLELICLYIRSDELGLNYMGDKIIHNFGISFDGVNLFTDIQSVKNED